MTKIWKVGIVKDSATMILGQHGLHNAFRGLPGVEVVAHVDSNTDNLAAKLDSSGARRHYADYAEMLDRERPDIVVLCSRHPGEHLIVLGTHILDLETFIFGAPEYVMADVTLNNRPIVKEDRVEKTVEPIGPAAGDHVFASFRFPNGVRGIFESRRGLASGESVQKTGIVDMGLCVVGTKGAISMRFKDSPWLPVSNIYNARLVQEMIQGIYASSISRRVVAFPLADRTHPLGE